jgi:replication-associated recombination protein RarA
MRLSEEFRPHTWTEVVAQDKAIKTIQAVGRRGFGARAWWIIGQPGTGKTTLAKLIAAEVAKPQNTLELEGRSLTVSRINEIEENHANDLEYARFLGHAPGRAYIIDESHGLRQDVIRRLKVSLDDGRIPDHVVWIFTTTTEEGQLLFDGDENPKPLLARCTQIALARRDITKPMAERLQAAARSVGLDGQPLEKYIALLRRADVGNDMRKAFQIIEAGEMLAN